MVSVYAGKDSSCGEIQPKKSPRNLGEFKPVMFYSFLGLHFNLQEPHVAF